LKKSPATPGGILIALILHWRNYTDFFGFVPLSVPAARIAPARCSPR